MRTGGATGTWAAAVCAALALLAAPARGAASTPDECQAGLKKISKTTEDLLFYGGGLGARSQSLMMSHLGKAKEFVDRGDPKNAMIQMDAFSTELSRATNARTIKMTDAIYVQEAANDIIVCMSGLSKPASAPSASTGGARAVTAPVAASPAASPAPGPAEPRGSAREDAVVVAVARPPAAAKDVHPAAQAASAAAAPSAVAPEAESTGPADAAVLAFAAPGAELTDAEREAVVSMARVAAKERCELLVWARARQPSLLREAQRRAAALKALAVSEGPLDRKQVVTRVTTRPAARAVDVVVTVLRGGATPAPVPAAAR